MKMSQKTSYRLILVGKTGSGKSATGNFLLNNNVFCSKQSANSVTQGISAHMSSNIKEYDITAVDTTGLFDTNKPVIQTALTIQESLKFVTPGPHAFLIVLKPGRFTEEEERTLEILMITFGPKFFDHAIIVYTHLDQLDNNMDEFLNEAKENERIKSLFDNCDNRIFPLNNKEIKKDIIERERGKLMQIFCRVSEYGRHFYADEIEMYRVCLKKHVDEWTETRWDVGKIQTILREQKEEAEKRDKERQEQFQKYEKEQKEATYKREEKHKRKIQKLQMKLMEAELRSTQTETMYRVVELVLNRASAVARIAVDETPSLGPTLFVADVHVPQKAATGAKKKSK